MRAKMQSRICTNCKELKEFNLFNKSKKGKYGISECCRECSKIKHKKYYLENPDKIKQKSIKSSMRRKESGYYKEYKKNNEYRLKEINRRWYEKNKNKNNELSKKRYALNKKSISISNKLYREKNKEVIKKRKQEYYLNNKDKISNYRRKYEKEKMSLKNKLGSKIRARIRLALKSYKKSESCKVLLGCDLSFYKEYLESKFTNGMSWENHGQYGWHIDHIIPCSSFNLDDLDQRKLCFHYTNTLPRWATTSIAVQYGEDENYIGNLEKSNKIIL